MRIIFSNRAYHSIVAETVEKIKTETGGCFLGCYENEIWYVIEAIDPGPKSVFQVAYFEYDKKYVEHLINKIARLYQANLTLIGLWHRHPGSMDVFSTTDAGTNSVYAKLSPHGAISVLVNIDPDFRLTPYHVASPCKYTKISYQVGDDLIPKHLLQLRDTEKSLDYINKFADKSHGGNTFEKPKIDFMKLLEGVKSKFQAVSLVQEDFKPEEAEKHKDHLIDSLLDDISYFSETRGLALNVEQSNGVLCLSHKGAKNVVTKIGFVYVAHKEQIVFVFNDVCYLYRSGMFAELLADYEPPESTFKEELIRRMGINKLV